MPEMEAVRSEDDHIVEKHRASMFFETNLDAKLRMLGIEHVIVSGVVTYFCVETSIRDAYYRDMDVTVVRETVAGPNQRFHEDTLAKVDAFWGAVVGLDELPSLMTTSSAGASA
jgi:ureidoacrylate peracid hydrolase